MTTGKSSSKRTPVDTLSMPIKGRGKIKSTKMM